MVNVFKILWPKYMMYFLYFNNKIQNTLFTENYYIIQTSRTTESMSQEVGYSRINNASDINPPLMNALNLLFEEYFEKVF